MSVERPLIGHRFGGYRITDVVGRGGMGTVYRARDENLDRDVALKVLPLDDADDTREAERFQREGRLAARLQHPNIVGVYGAGTGDGYLYLAMELVAGQPLRSRMRQKPGLSIDEALSIGAQVLEAVVAAHDGGITHRDIKPDNILLREDGTVKVLDFGVAKIEDGTLLTRADEILGTVEYMAPEQIMGEKVGPATDLYAVGVLLYEMITGVLPVSGDSPATLVYHQLNEEPHAPSLLNVEIPRNLDHFVLRLLEKLPEDRYGSAAEALEELTEIRRRRELGNVPGLDEEVGGGETLPQGKHLQPRFTGRESELESLKAHFDSVAEGGRVVFVAGEAGVGKTAILRELTRSVRDRGSRAVEGSCFYEHGMGPYMPFFDAISNLLSGGEDEPEAGRDVLRHLLRERAPELEALASSPTTTAKVRAGFAAAFGAESNDQSARQRLFDTIFDLLATAAATSSLLICLEDLHWADEGSVQLLQYLVRRSLETRVLIVVTYRPEELVADEPNEHPLAELIQQLNAEGDLHRVDVGRMSRAELNKLVKSLFPDSAFSDEFGEFLHQQSQGNPFMAVEVLRLLRQQDILYCESGVWSVTPDLGEMLIPERVNALVMRRVSQLDTEQRELLQMAAIAGQRFDSAVLEATSGLPRMDLLKSLFRLEKRNQLIVSGNGGYEFSHSKIREVLYSEVPAELRREYHRIVGQVLEEEADRGVEIPDDELGSHLYRAEEYERAIPFLVRAADDAFRLFGWRRAAALYDRAAEACRQVGQTSDARIRALRFGAMAYVYLTVYDSALERSEEMREVARTAGRPADEAEAWKIVGKVHEQRRRLAEAVADYEKAVACLEGVEAPSVKARIMINWGCADFECGRYDEARSRWTEALALALETDLSERGQALNNLAIIACIGGDLDEAWELYERSLALHAQAGPTPQTVLTYYNMGMIRADQERWDEALDLYDHSLEVCRSANYLFHEPAIELNRTEALIGKGNLVEGRRACSRALRGFRRLDDTLGLADALRLYGRLCRLERNWDDGRTYLDKSIAMNREFGESVSLAESLEEMGLLERDVGDSTSALSHLRQAERIFSQADAAPDLDRVRSGIAELGPG